MDKDLIIIGAVAIVGWKFLNNKIKQWFLERELNRYHKWLEDKKSVGWKIVENEPRVIALLKNAKVDDMTRPYIEVISGQQYQIEAPVFQNYPSHREDFKQFMLKKFHQGIGIYGHKAWEALNPLYWIELVIEALPRALMFLASLVGLMFGKAKYVLPEAPKAPEVTDEKKT